MKKTDRNINGILCLDKPSGVTSHDMVGLVRRLYGTRKVGHTGTLDPMATGVLVVLIGRAAKASDLLLAKEKEYTAAIKLGITTDTLDITGSVCSEHNGSLPGQRELEALLPSFTGNIRQIPPMYSAIKKDGRKLYELARQGIEIERDEREIVIRSLECSGSGKQDNEYILHISCSKGTYIRTLCADIGEALGCGAVMSSLRRTANGGFNENSAVTVSELEAMSPEERDACLVPVERAFEEFPALSLPPFFEKLARCGNEIYQNKISSAFPPHTLVRLYGSGVFFALGEVLAYNDTTAIKPIKQFDID